MQLNAVSVWKQRLCLNTTTCWVIAQLLGAVDCTIICTMPLYPCLLLILEWLYSYSNLLFLSFSVCFWSHFNVKLWACSAADKVTSCSYAEVHLHGLKSLSPGSIHWWERSQCRSSTCQFLIWLGSDFVLWSVTSTANQQTEFLTSLFPIKRLA